MKWIPKGLDISSYKYIIGIDEVGRGPLAGPVTVGAVAIPVSFLQEKNVLKKLKFDSKGLSERGREMWAEEIAKFPWPQAVVSVSSKVIDTKGIMHAIRTAAAKAVGQLQVPILDGYILSDAGLPYPKEYAGSHYIKGDATYIPIACASILAKVNRDALMVKYDKKHPVYGFGRHKGYGTAAHYAAIKKHGPSMIHRRSFLKA